ncbi:MAG: 50S ribosomal protein L24 [Patescibacteria group bacterium]
MKLKKGDNVKILKGKDSKKTGKILQVIKPSSAVKTRVKRNVKVVVEGLNLRYKHLRPKRGGEKGQRIMFPAPINISAVQLICPKCGKPVRVGFILREGKSEVSREKKNRICKKCKGIF